LIAGERRWRASQLAGLATVPVLVKEAAPQRMLEMALVENFSAPISTRWKKPLRSSS
jgi:ParB/RepB/Spo0J family partition protein